MTHRRPSTALRAPAMLATSALALAASLGLALFGLGCESRVSLGTRCDADAQCSGLRCRYGRCRAECERAADCTQPGAFCIGAAGQGVCTVPSLDVCTEGCGELTCGEAGGCSTPCLPGASDCLEGASCGSAGVCVADPPGLDAGSSDDTSIDGAVPIGEDTGLGDVGVADVCVSRYLACAVLRPDGRVVCWGTGTNGELGGGASLVAGAPGVTSCTPAGVTALCSLTPVTVVEESGAPLLDIERVHCGERTVIALAGDGRLLSWGLFSGGQLGRPTTASVVDAHAAHVLDADGAPLQGITEVSMGLNHGCAIGTAQTFCWGAQDPRFAYGQLGTGVVDAPLVDGAVEATTLARAQHVAVANENTCAVGSTGAVVCLGSNEHAAAGATSAPRTAPIVSPNPVSGAPTSAAELVAGAAFFCARSFDGRVSCWGQAGEGSLGRGAIDASYQTRCPAGGSNFLCDPMAGEVLGGRSFTAISAGPQGSTVCGIADGLVYCWGQSESGAGGAPTRLYEPGGPILREDGSELRDVERVRVAGITACAVTTSHALYCWGGNDAGILARTPDADTHTRAVLVALE